MSKSCSKVKALKCVKIIIVPHNNIKCVQLKAQPVLHKGCPSSNRSNKKIIIIVKENRMFKNKF
jgi:hypothetical protein